MGYEARFDEERLFGVEIEVFGVDRDDIHDALYEAEIVSVDAVYCKEVLPTWRLSNDSSIVGAYATEVVSPPLKGREGLAEVARVMNVLSTVGCKVNSTCAYHVHWNVQDYTGKNILSLLRLYAKFESVIDFLVSPSRRWNENSYCRSMIKDNDLSWISSLDKTEKLRAVDVAIRFSSRHPVYVMDEETGRPIEKGSRYYKLNVTAYTQYGTVEFRQHQGTVNSEKALNWIVFTQQLVTKSKEVAVSKKPSAKPTLGEMLRTLGIVDRKLMEQQCTDPLIIHLGEWLKSRHKEFSRGVDDE